jgi:hypothetical protein
MSIRQLKSQIKALKDAGVGQCIGPRIITLREGHDFPPYGEPPERGPCEFCGVKHKAYNGAPRRIILMLPRDRDTHEIPRDWLEKCTYGRGATEGPAGPAETEST